IMVDLLSRQAKARPVVSHHAITPETEQEEVKNSQVAVLSAVILAGALIVAASNYFLVQRVRGEFFDAADRSTATFTLPDSAGRTAGTPNGAKPVVALMPKA